MRLKRTVDAATEPVTLEEANNYLKLNSDGGAEDDLVTEMITAARNICEEYTQRSFITQTWAGYMRDFPPYGNVRDDSIILPRGDVLTVTSIHYAVDAAFDTLLATNLYSTGINAGGLGIISPIDSWPSTDTDFPEGVRVIWTAGYGAASAVPYDIKIAIKLVMGDLYENRQSFVRGQGSTLSHNGKTVMERILDRYKIYAR